MPEGVVFVAQEYQATTVSFHSQFIAFARESTSQWHCISPHLYDVLIGTRSRKNSRNITPGGSALVIRHCRRVSFFFNDFKVHFYRKQPVHL